MFWSCRGSDHSLRTSNLIPHLHITASQRGHSRDQANRTQILKVHASTSIHVSIVKLPNVSCQNDTCQNATILVQVLH